MSMSCTYVLLRVFPSFQRCNPCIFVMCVVTSASLQSGALGNSDFRDLVIPLSPWSRIASRIAYQNVRLRENIISFHCIIFIWVHIDARNVVIRGLLELIVRSAAPFRYLSFLPWFLCAWYAHELYICFVKGFAIFPEVQPMYFCDVYGD